jgi:hypothetical protein
LSGRFADLMDLSKDRSRLDFFLRKAPTAPAATCVSLAAQEEAAAPGQAMTRGSTRAVASAQGSWEEAAVQRVSSSPAQLGASAAGASGVRWQEPASVGDEVVEQRCAASGGGASVGQEDVRWLAGSLERTGPPDCEDLGDEMSEIEDSDAEADGASEAAGTADLEVIDPSSSRRGFPLDHAADAQTANRQHKYSACSVLRCGTDSSLRQALHLSDAHAAAGCAPAGRVSLEELVKLGLDSPPKAAPCVPFVCQAAHAHGAAARIACKSEPLSECGCNTAAQNGWSGDCGGCSRDDKKSTCASPQKVEAPVLSRADSWSSGSDSDSSQPGELSAACDLDDSHSLGTALATAASAGQTEGCKAPRAAAQGSSFACRAGADEQIISSELCRPTSRRVCISLAACCRQEEVRWKADSCGQQGIALHRCCTGSTKQVYDACQPQSRALPHLERHAKPEAGLLVDLTAIDVAEQERIMRSIQLCSSGKRQPGRGPRLAGCSAVSDNEAGRKRIEAEQACSAASGPKAVSSCKRRQLTLGMYMKGPLTGQKD